MPKLSELAKIAGQREISRAEAKKAAHKKELAAGLRRRKINTQIDKSVAWMIGSTIRDMFKADRLTPQQLAVVGDILLLVPEDERPENWDLLAPYLPPVRPKVVRDEAAAA
jgi:hypothetical protein